METTIDTAKPFVIFLHRSELIYLDGEFRVHYVAPYVQVQQPATGAWGRVEDVLSNWNVCVSWEDYATTERSVVGWKVRL